MNVRINVTTQQGFSLIENIASLGLLAAILPTLLVTVLMSETEREKESIERLSLGIARAIFAELPLVWEGGETKLFQGNYEFPNIGKDGAVSLLINEQGEVQLIDTAEQVYSGSSGMIGRIERVASGARDGISISTTVLYSMKVYKLIKSQTGFTLLEVLVGAVIGVILLLISYSFIQVGARGYKRGAEAVSESRGARTAFDIIKQDLDRMCPDLPLCLGVMVG